jgi:hypothetical protein
MINEIRTELRFAWRSFVIPAALILCALIAVANVFSAVGTLNSAYSDMQHTHAQYLSMHTDWAAAISKPDTVVTVGDMTTASNPARYSYDQFTTSVIDLSPGSSVPETLKYIGFIVYPALFFLIGVWLVTGQRRYRLDKVALVRAGGARGLAAKQCALGIIAAVCVAATLAIDVAFRSVLYAQAASSIPLYKYPPLPPIAAHSAVEQWGVALLAIMFFGAAGVAIGTFSGVFAIPAVVFLGYNFVFPILWVHDPRNWFQVLGHAAFDYSGAFELADPKPLAIPIALVASVISTLAFIGLGYVGIRIRNPRAT